MCPSERKITAQLTDQLENWKREDGGLSFVDPDGWPCRGTVRDNSGNKRRCLNEKNNSCTIFPRKVTLLTLNHDMLSIVCNDWACTSCGYENKFTGKNMGSTLLQGFACSPLSYCIFGCTIAWVTVYRSVLYLN